MARLGSHRSKDKDKRPSTGKDGTKWTHDMLYCALNDGSDLVTKTVISTDGKVGSVIVDNIKCWDGNFHITDENGQEHIYGQLPETVEPVSKAPEKQRQRHELAVLVQKGGKQDYECAAGDGIIPKGTPHMRVGAKDYKRYHTGCWKEINN